MKAIKLKNIFRSLCMATGIFLLPSCAESLDGPGSNGPKDNDTFLKLDISMSDTRGVVEGSAFQQGDEVLVIAYVPGKATSCNAQSKATWNGDEWVFEKPIDLAGKTPQGNEWGNEVEIGIFYPYSKVMNHDIMIDDDQVYIYDYYMPDYDNDILVGYDKSLSKTNPYAKIQVHHAFTRLTIDLQNNTSDYLDVHNFVLRNKLNVFEEEFGGWIREFVNIEVGGILYDKTTDKDTWKWNYETKLPYENRISAGDSYKIEILMVPTEDRYEWSQEINRTEGFEAGGLELVFDANGKEVKVTLPARPWAAGQRYTYPVKIGKGGEIVNPDLPEGLEKVYLGFDGDDGKPLYWANMNLGANYPWEAGDYFAWGEVTPKDNYTYETSQTCQKNISELLDLGIINSSFNLTQKFDAAHVNWGEGWRIPTQAELEKLVSNCSWTWKTQGGKKGYEVIGTNGYAIFIPAAGYYSGITLKEASTKGYYRSATCDENVQGLSLDLIITDYKQEFMYMSQGLGQNIRPVYSEP